MIAAISHSHSFPVDPRPLAAELRHYGKRHCIAIQWKFYGYISRFSRTRQDDFARRCDSLIPTLILLFLLLLTPKAQKSSQDRANFALNPRCVVKSGSGIGIDAGLLITVKVVGIAMAKNGDSAAFAVFLEGQGLGVIVKDVRELDEKIDRGQYVPVREE